MAGPSAGSQAAVGGAEERQAVTSGEASQADSATEAEKEKA